MSSQLHLPASPQHLAVHECPDCGLFSRLTKPVPGIDMRCMRCDKILRRVHINPLDKGLICAFAALFFYALALTTPYITAWLYDSFATATLLTGPFALDDNGFWFLATVVMLFTIVTPLAKILGIIVVLLELKRDEPPRGIATLFGWIKELNTWSMIEVYLLGFIVAYSRLQVIMQVRIDVAALGLVGLMFCMAGIDAVLDPEAVWEEMRRKRVVGDDRAGGGRLYGCDTCHKVCRGHEGEPCPRCGEPLHERKANSFNRTWALTISAALLYIPSNLFPVMTVMKFGRYHTYTIFEGLSEFVKIGLWPLAVLVFVASIAIPLFKLLSLVFLLIETKWRPQRWICFRTRLYRVIDFIGRWSMVDIFMVSILVALVHFGATGRISAEPGAIYFTGVVILTLLAVESFDPRLMWDAALKDEAMQGKAGSKKAGPLPATPDKVTA
jgi:paraquat-inducible protein A